MGNTFRRIVFPTDFSATSESALKQAVALAEKYQCELHLVTVVDHTLYSYARYPDSGLREDLVAAAEQRIRIFDLPPMSKRVKIVRVVLEGDIAEQIAAYTRDYEIDLILMASHARSKVARFFLGSVADQVLHLAACPAIVLRAPEGTPKNPMPQDRRFNAIVVPTDFSKPAEQGLARAINFAKDYKAQLHVVHVIDDRKLLVLQEDKRKEALRKIREDVQEQLDELIETVPSEIRTSAEILIGEASDRIGHYAGKHNVDLIVIGARASDEFKRLLVGSVADSLVRIVDCPVFVEHVVEDAKGSGVSTARIEAAIGGITIRKARKKAAAARKPGTTTSKKASTKTVKKGKTGARRKTSKKASTKTVKKGKTGARRKTSKKVKKSGTTTRKKK